MNIWSHCSKAAAGVVALALALVIAGAPIAEACQCLDRAAGFRLPEGTRLPANAVGVPWIGHLRDEGRAGARPVAGDFKIEMRDGSFWRTLRSEVVEPPDLAQARKGPDDEPIVLVRPRGGFRPGSLYRMSTALDAERNVVEFPVADRSLRVGKAKATLVVGPVVHGPVVASTLSGSCSTTFPGISTTVQLVLPEYLEKSRDVLLFALVDEQGRLWRPDVNLCERTLIGGNSLGPGNERIYASCPPPDVPSGTVVTARSDETRPAEEYAQGKEMKFEFIAWLPGTAERIVAKGRITLECARKGR